MTSPADINAKMVRVAPELASNYATYPMSRSRWYAPNEADPNTNQPCFIPRTAGQGTELKPDYVFGQGPAGIGYYSLLTKPAYKILYARVANTAPSGCCACSKEAREEFDAHDDTRRLLYNRVVASVPNDRVGQNEAINKAQQTAQAHYQFQQNAQVVIGGVQAGVNLAG